MGPGNWSKPNIYLLSSMALAQLEMKEGRKCLKNDCPLTYVKATFCYKYKEISEM